jgi:hypothetical protein
MIYYMRLSIPILKMVAGSNLNDMHVTDEKGETVYK